MYKTGFLPLIHSPCIKVFRICRNSGCRLCWTGRFTAWLDKGDWCSSITLFAAVLVILFFRLGLLIINGPRIVPAIITALFTFFILSFVNVRPHVFDFIVIVSTALLLEKYTIQGNIRWLIPLPIIEVVEMNLHMTMWPLMFIVGAATFLLVIHKGIRIAELRY
ncbi:MAG: hypothetical protein V8S24_04710 [Gordonibacter pamelaeae]